MNEKHRVKFVFFLSFVFFFKVRFEMANFIRCFSFQIDNSGGIERNQDAILSIWCLKISRLRNHWFLHHFIFWFSQGFYSGLVKKNMFQLDLRQWKQVKFIDVLGAFCSDKKRVSFYANSRAKWAKNCLHFRPKLKSTPKCDWRSSFKHHFCDVFLFSS